MNFNATNEFPCPHCAAMMGGAVAFHPDHKPMDGHFTICAECAGICIYVIKEGVISMRKPIEQDLQHAREVGLMGEIEEMVDFVKSKPKQ
jgi:hypothetical protein